MSPRRDRVSQEYLRRRFQLLGMSCTAVANAAL